ncbi:MAG: hypothetical protein QOH68_3162, partial [Nocardioidaceae bacterium]|nr:hypothetical protein [Nocardioidaceae bacterium]
YRWVSPPPGAAKSNQSPLDRRAELPAVHDRLLATEVWTGDLQAVLALEEVGLRERPRTSVSVAITAVDPAELAVPPEGQFPEGNAYRLDLDDGGTPIDRIDPAGRLILTVPHPAATVLFSRDGTRWTVLVAEPSDRDVTVGLERTGFYLAAADHAVGAGGRGPGGLTVGLLLVLPAVALAGLLLAKRRP